MASDIIERLKASAWRHLCLPLLPFTHARSESINADNLNSNFLQLGRRSGGQPQRAVHPMRLPVTAIIFYSKQMNMVHDYYGVSLLLSAFNTITYFLLSTYVVVILCDNFRSKHFNNSVCFVHCSWMSYGKGHSYAHILRSWPMM